MHLLAQKYTFRMNIFHKYLIFFTTSGPVPKYSFRYNKNGTLKFLVSHAKIINSDLIF